MRILKKNKVDTLELKNTIIKIENNLLHERNCRFEMSEMRISGSKYRTTEIIQIENKKGKRLKKMDKESDTIKYQHTYHYIGVMESWKKRKREEGSGKCICRTNAHNFQN